MTKLNVMKTKIFFLLDLVKNNLAPITTYTIYGHHVYVLNLYKYINLYKQIIYINASIHEGLN
jgi:hypothetical protein